MPFVHIDVLAHIYGVHVENVRRMLHAQNTFPVVMVGKRRRVPRVGLAQQLETSGIVPAGQGFAAIAAAEAALGLTGDGGGDLVPPPRPMRTPLTAEQIDRRVDGDPVVQAAARTGKLDVAVTDAQ